MKPKLLIVGAGGFGRVTLEHASRQFDCAFVDDGQAVGTVVDGVEVVGDSSDLQRLCIPISIWKQETAARTSACRRKAASSPVWGIRSRRCASVPLRSARKRWTKAALCSQALTKKLAAGCRHSGADEP